ncbi:MAG TPA: Fe-S protein assembly co-chaperone HscB [Burkholderiales bacterium]|jgi:molecular chaperone HscB|nr:Fe-S protein assembly co-chaperone HscB [Burkholderiales bacterium]
MSKTRAAAAKALTSSHFELFGLPAQFALDLERLDRGYRDIQAKVHPDRFAHAGDAERRASMQMTTRVNEAYRVLKDPLQRAIHLLELNGVDVAFETDTAMPKEFLMRQMEMRERLEEAKSSAALASILEDLNREKKEIEQQLTVQFDARDFQGARTLVRKLMFFDRLAEEVDEAYDTLET